MKQSQIPQAERMDQLLEIGARLASKYGASNVTRRMVAQEAKVTDPLVSIYMGRVPEAQARWRAHCKKMGLPHPSKKEEAEMGLQMRKRPRKK